jgi:hypothetical protein
MADFPIYRLVKGSTLSFTEMDDNLRWLSANMSASVVTITGSAYVAGNLTVSDGIIGSLFGTSSWAVSASNAVNSISASYVSGSGAIVTNLSSSNDANINGLTVGRGGGNLSNNTAIGYQALTTNSIGTGNTATGVSALYLNTSGNYNVANGTWALENNTTGGSNIAVGVQALRNNTTGGSNSAVGRDTLRLNSTGSANSSFGAFSMYNNIGSNNSSFGANSLYSNTTGEFNTVLGMQALNWSTTGNNNTSIGAYSGYGTSTTFANRIGNNNIFIGYQSVGVSPNESNRTWIGNSSTTSTWLGGNLILGQTSDFGPKLQITGDATITGSLTVSQNITASNALFTGTITAQTLVVQTITSSITYSSGSNIFGNKTTDTHQFTGSVLAPSITGSLQGTSSWAVSASWAPSAGGGTTLNGSGYVSMSGTTVAYVSAIPNSSLANSAITIQGSSTALGGSVNVINGTGFVKSSGTSITYDNSTYYSASNPNGYTSNAGTITSITVSPGTGMSGGGTLTGAGGTLTLTNSAPDQTVVLNNGTGISVTGTYPNFTISSTGTGATISSYIATGSVSASVNVGNTAFNLVSSSNNLVTILSNGNVGIGKTTPNAKLDVSGSSIFTKTITTTDSRPTLTVTGSFNTTGEATALYIDIATLLSSTASLIDAKMNGFSVLKVSNTATCIASELQVDNNIIIKSPGSYLWLNDTVSSNIGYFVTTNNSVFSIYEDETYGGLQLDPLANLSVDGNITASANLLAQNGGIKTSAPSGRTAETWKLGDVNGGTISPDVYITIEINGQIYSIPALQGLP